jgi:hypothetical protein
MIETHFPQVLPPEEHYCIPKLNEIRFIGHRQTLSLVLGSCISTVFVGGSGPFVVAANHIVIANPREGSIVATKSAQEQIDEIVGVYEQAFGIGRNDICCLHLIGAGSKSGNKEFRVPEENIREAEKILAGNSFNVMFKDTGSYFFATYSLFKTGLAVVIENKMKMEHISFTIDLERMIRHNVCDSALLSASALARSDPGFEYLVSEGVISFITGSRDRNRDS